VYSYRPHSPKAQAVKGHVVMDEQARRRLRRLRLRRAAVVLGVIAALVGAIALYRSPLLRVQEVQVVGATHLDPQQLVQMAGLEGASMFDPPLERAESRIAALPLVRSVEAKRHWPNSVRIEVIERAPWGLWIIGETPYVIDAEGVVLEGVPLAEGAPVIRDLGGPAKLIAGDRVDVDAVVLAQSLLQRAPALAVSVTAFEYTPQAGLALTTDASYRVVVGDSQNFDYKMAVWQAIERELGREAMAGHVLDLRFESRPSFQ